MRELDRESWSKINDAVKDVVKNFERITGYKKEDVINFEGLFDDEKIEETYPYI